MSKRIQNQHTNIDGETIATVFVSDLQVGDVMLYGSVETGFWRRLTVGSVDRGVVWVDGDPICDLAHDETIQIVDPRDAKVAA